VTVRTRSIYCYNSIHRLFLISGDPISVDGN